MILYWWECCWEQIYLYWVDCIKYLWMLTRSEFSFVFIFYWHFIYDWWLLDNMGNVNLALNPQEDRSVVTDSKDYFPNLEDRWGISTSLPCVWLPVRFSLVSTSHWKCPFSSGFILCWWLHSNPCMVQVQHSILTDGGH